MIASPLCAAAMAGSIGFLVFLFGLGRFLIGRLQIDTATATVSLFFRHQDHLLSITYPNNRLRAPGGVLSRLWHGRQNAIPGPMCAYFVYAPRSHRFRLCLEP